MNYAITEDDCDSLLKYSDIEKFGAMIGVRNFSIWKSQRSHTRDERTYNLVYQALYNRGYDMSKLDLINTED